MPLVIHITPQLPPQICGLGDYATRVGGKMAGFDGIQCAFVAAGHKLSGEPSNGRNVRNISGHCDPAYFWRAIDDLRAQVQPSAGVSIVLNYSGYGYERNGCPEWLVDVLSKRPRWVNRVVTFFHELFATGMPWQRAFWYSRRQQRITVSLCKLSDSILTNREQSARWLVTANPAATCGTKYLAVPSNVGELSLLSDCAHRSNVAVCFGSRRFKQPFFSSSAPATAKICNKLGIRQIINIGELLNTISPQLNSHRIEVVQTGYLRACEVSKLLSKARIAFASYFPDGFAKSGVIAALAAHGVPIITEDSCRAAADGLAPGEHYLGISNAADMAAECNLLPHALDGTSSKLFSWYQSHSVMEHARLVAKAAIGDAPA